MRVISCVPSHGDMKAKFVASLLALHKKALLSGIDIDTATISGSLVDVAREKLAKFALGEKADYLLWHDVDMTFPPDALGRLLAHGLPVVGANYRLRNDRLKESTATMRATKDGRAGYVPIAPKMEGLEEVDAMGLGLCLMRADVFKDLETPWFLAGQESEDSFFFRRLREQKGIRPVVDHWLSLQVGHIAETVLMF